MEAGGKKMIREIDGGGSSHISQNSVIAHFGLGNAQKVDSIIVHWTGGNKQMLKDILVNQKIIISEIPQHKSKPLVMYLVFGLVIIIVGFVLVKWRKSRLHINKAHKI